MNPSINLTSSISFKPAGKKLLAANESIWKNPEVLVAIKTSVVKDTDIIFILLPQ